MPDDPFLRTVTALDETGRHLQATKAEGSPIESYLTQHILVLLAADIESALHEVVLRRCSSLQDEALREYIGNSLRHCMRSLKKEALVGFLGLFGAGVKVRFSAALPDEVVQTYGIALNGRNDVAHEDGASVSLVDLRRALESARNVLAEFERALTGAK